MGFAPGLVSVGMAATLEAVAKRSSNKAAPDTAPAKVAEKQEEQ